MVSLGSDGDRQGAYFFDQDVCSAEQTTNDEEELLSCDNHLTNHCEPTYMPIRTEFVAVIQMFLIVLFILILFLFPLVFVGMLYPEEGIEQQQRYGLSIIVYSQVGVFVCLVLMERYLHVRHRESLRQGYLEFYRETQQIKRIPSYTFAVGNAIILSGLMITLDFNWGASSKSSSNFSGIPIYVLQFIGVVECTFAWVGSLMYAVKVFRFNKRCEQPDVEQEEAIAAAVQPTEHIQDVGFKDTSYVDNLLEKQADLIHYLKQHTVYLNKLIIKMKNQTVNNEQMSNIG